MKELLALMYHRIRPKLTNGPYPNRGSTVSKEDFELQIRCLSEKHNVITPEQALSFLLDGVCLPERAVLLTFDDGQSDFYTHAYPILKKYGFSAVMFLPSSFIGEGAPFWWDRLEESLLSTAKKKICFRGKTYSLKRKDKTFGKFDRIISSCDDDEKRAIVQELCGLLDDREPSGRASLDWTQIKEMSQNGIVFGAHTLTHARLSGLEDSKALNEIFASKKAIEDRIGKTVKLFAYPYGARSDFSKVHEEMVEKAGFKAAFSTFKGLISSASPLFSLPRVAVSGYDNFWSFKAKLRNANIITEKIMRRVLR